MLPFCATLIFTAKTGNEDHQVIIDPKSRKEYIRGKLLGKGGYAECYEFMDTQTNVAHAAKIVSKNRLHTPRHKANIEDEINIHKTLHHKHIVGFHGHFEDNDNVYIILELCAGRSLAEIHRRRKILTEDEVRYFLNQLLLACEYMRQERVIHRDLKLGNLLLTEDMQLKVADFGVATRITYEGELKKGSFGTPNYVAPEVLAKTGHSYEADVWSIGCILYKLLVGEPPFNSSSHKEIYARIKKNDYYIPPTVSPDASALIRWMLSPEPSGRPSIKAIMNHDFMTKALLPAQLTASCLKKEPLLDALSSSFDAANQKLSSEKNEAHVDQACGCSSSTQAESSSR